MPDTLQTKEAKQQSSKVQAHKKMTARTRTAVATAAVLFFITFFIQFAQSNIIPASGNELTDWRFVCTKEASAVEGEIASFRQATASNRVSRELGSPYMRLQYTLPETETDRRLVLLTANNPIRVDVDGAVLFDGGYRELEFTGGSYQSVFLPAGEERIIDIYLYAPLAFSFNAYLEQAEITASEGFMRYIGFGVSLAVIILGIGLLVLTVLLTARSRHIRRLLMLSATVIAGGAAALLYAFSRTSGMLSSPCWFSALLISELLLMMLVCATVLSCYSAAFKNAAIWIPVVILCAIIPIFQTAWAVRTVAAAAAAAQLYAAIKADRAFLSAASADVPYVGSVRGLLYYSALIGIYNTVALFLGLKPLSGYLFACSIVLVCIVIFVVYCRQIIYLDIKKYERIRQLYTDSAWIEDITSLIAKMFLQKEEIPFLTGVAGGLSDIIEKNSAINDEDIEVHSCVGVLDGDNFAEVYNSGPVEGCEYMSIYSHLEKQAQKLLIGNTSADMLFQMDGHSAVIHFENILCGMTSGIENIIKTAYLNLFSAYQNLNMKKDVTDIQEELFINLAVVVEQKYKATTSHLITVSALAHELCLRLGMSEERHRLISLAAMTHDIGKLGVSESVLEKQGPLNEDEFELMKQHTEIGFHILSLQKGAFFETAAVIAREHHENFDGSGYMGLKGRKISPAARLVRVADVVDALLSKRSYKEAWSEQQVIEYLENEKGRLFDPAVVEAFLGSADALFALRRHIAEDKDI